MTKRLEEVIERLRELPDEEQNAIAELVSDIVGSDPTAYRLTPEQAAEVERRLADPSPTVTNDEVRRFFEQKAG